MKKVIVYLLVVILLTSVSIAYNFYDYEETEIVKEKSDRICLYALVSMAPYLTALCRDTPEDDWINYKETIQCPDADRPVIFKVEREPWTRPAPW